MKYGTLMSANNLAQLVASYFWGWASDVTGRKPLLLLSNIVSGAASAWFVSTRTFGQGIAARAISGGFTCGGVVMKAMIGLHYTKQGQAIAMAWRTLGAGVGQIVTPLIIASLSDPCTLYSGGVLGRSAACQAGGFLKDDPFVLCGFFTVFVGAIATLTNWFLVPNDPPKEWSERLKARLRAKLWGKRGVAADAEATAAGAAAGTAGAAATAAAAAAAASKVGDAAVNEDGSGSSSSSSSDEEEEVGAGLAGEENALTSLLSVLSLPPEPVPLHHHRQHASAAAADVEGGPSGASAPLRPRGRLPVVPSSVFMAQSQEQEPSTRGGSGPASTSASTAAAAASPTSAGRHSVALPPALSQQQQGAVQRRRASLFAGARASGTGGSGRGSSESAFGRRLSAAATSFGVLAIAAGDYCNTINDVDAARTAAALARQQNALRHRRRASSIAAAASSAAASAASSAGATAGSGPLSGALSSAKPSSKPSSKPSTVLSSKKTGEADGDKSGDVEVAAAAKIVPWYRNRASLVAIFAFALTTMLNESILDLYQFYATSTPCPFPDRGPALNAGLCLDVTKTSLTVAVGGAGVVAFSLFAYPPLQRRFGVAFCCKFGLFIGAVMCLVFATARYALPLGAGPLLAVLVVAQLLYGVGFSATSTASMIMVNLCAPPGQVGAVNGAANLLMSASRIVGPYIVGASFFFDSLFFTSFFCVDQNPKKVGKISLFSRSNQINQAPRGTPWRHPPSSISGSPSPSSPGCSLRRWWDTCSWVCPTTGSTKKMVFSYPFLSCFLVLRFFKRLRRPFLCLLGTPHRTRRKQRIRLMRQSQRFLVDFEN